MFSSEEIDQIIGYLGYPLHDGASQQIQAAIARSTAASPGIESRIKGYLRELERIDDDLNETRPFAARTFQTTAGGSAQMSPAYRMSSIANEGRRYVALLAKALWLPVYDDYFASGGGGGGTVSRVRS